MWPLRMHVYHHIWVVYGVALTAGCIGSCRRVAVKCWCSQTGQVRSDSCRSTWARSSCWSDHNCNTHIMTHIPHYYSSPINNHLFIFIHFSHLSELIQRIVWSMKEIWEIVSCVKATFWGLGFSVVLSISSYLFIQPGSSL